MIGAESPILRRSRRLCRDVSLASDSLCHIDMEHDESEDIHWQAHSNASRCLLELDFERSSNFVQFSFDLSILFATFYTATYHDLFSTMKALVGADAGGYSLVENVDIPVPQRGSMLVHVHAVALNPRDAKIVDFSNVPGGLGGCDFAGTVAKVGEGVTRFKEGDRVLAVTFGSDPMDKGKGAFAEFALAEEDISCHIPEAFSFPQACSIGLSMATAGLALFQAPGLELSMQGGKGETVLVSGGATATGTMATQLLKM